jgi:hypothetical protein
MSTPIDIPPPPSQVQPPPRERHRVRKTLLIIGGAFTALILLIVIIAVATSHSNSIKPAAVPSTTPTSTAQSYPSVASLLAAMAAHGATCTNVSIQTGSTVTGALSTFAECSGFSSGDTAIVMFADHADALAYANRTLSLSSSASLGPAAEVVGPNWTVNTVPAFAPKVVSAVGGQLITAPASTATSAPAATPTPSLSTEPVGGTFTDTTTDSTTGATTSYDVTLDQVSQNINPGAYETPQNPGDHYAAAQFTITGTSGSTSDDANSDATAIGSDGQQYTFASIASLPTFSYGEWHVSPGISVKGWVAFELPPGVTVASVQWAPDLSGSAATWTVGS